MGVKRAEIDEMRVEVGMKESFLEEFGEEYMGYLCGKNGR